MAGHSRVPFTLIRKIGAIMTTQSLSLEYGEYLVELRAQCKPKRNFIKLLDAAARSHGIA